MFLQHWRREFNRWGRDGGKIKFMGNRMSWEFNRQKRKKGGVWFEKHVVYLTTKILYLVQYGDGFYEVTEEKHKSCFNCKNTNSLGYTRPGTDKLIGKIFWSERTRSVSRERSPGSDTGRQGWSLQVVSDKRDGLYEDRVNTKEISFKERLSRVNFIVKGSNWKGLFG